MAFLLFLSIMTFILVEAKELQIISVVATELGQYEVAATELRINSVIATELIYNLGGVTEVVGNTVGATEMVGNSVGATELKQNLVDSTELLPISVATTSLIMNSVTGTGNNNKFGCQNLNSVVATAIQLKQLNLRLLQPLYIKNYIPGSGDTEVALGMSLCWNRIPLITMFYATVMSIHRISLSELMALHGIYYVGMLLPATICMRGP